MAENGIKSESGLGLYHPLVSFGYFVAVITGTLLFIHPFFSYISLFSAIIFSALINGKKTLLATFGFGASMFIFVALGNPLFNHRGVTTLFYLWGNPITLEAFAYGIVSAGMMLGAVVWFTCYNTVISSDKFLYVFGKALPSIALTVSMTISLIPRLTSQVKVIADAQRTLGLDWKSGTPKERAHAGARILSVLVSWALEDAVTTADSMRARGYGGRKRSSFSIFRFSKRDGIMLSVIALFFAAEIFTYATGRGTMTFYPAMELPKVGAGEILLYGAFLALGFLPTAIQIKEDRKWKKLK